MINLAVTTRQWNPGDDFILHGIKNLFPQEACWTIYNRNPDNKLSAGNHWTGQSLSSFDNLIIAGTPQWYGNSVKKLFEAVVENPIPVYFLGVGFGEAGGLNLTELDLQVLNMARVITTRGPKCKEILSEYGIKSKSMVCPAFFAEKEMTFQRGSVGCVLTAKHTWRFNPVDDRDFVQKQIALYKELNDEEVIVHYIDEIEFAQKHFKRVLYSYDPKDYKEIYVKYGTIVSSRLHGAVYGMSLGKTACLIDTRSKRCQDVASEMPPLIFCEPEQVMDKLKETSNAIKHEEIFEFKEQMKEKYKQVISQ